MLVLVLGLLLLVTGGVCPRFIVLPNKRRRRRLRRSKGVHGMRMVACLHGIQMSESGERFPHLRFARLLAHKEMNEGGDQV